VDHEPCSLAIRATRIESAHQLVGFVGAAVVMGE
jgi:hypothetical protein